MNSEPISLRSESILKEIHAIKDQNGRRFDYDIRALARDLMARQVLLPVASLAAEMPTSPSKLKRRTQMKQKIMV